MAKSTFILFFLVFIAATSTSKAQVKKQCEYEVVVNTGPAWGPTHKLWAVLQANHSESIKTNDLFKEWGTMGAGHTYFKADARDVFKTKGPCVKSNFCQIRIGGGKKDVEMKPHWRIANLTISTKGPGVNRLRTFTPFFDTDYPTTNPAVIIGGSECIA